MILRFGMPCAFQSVTVARGAPDLEERFIRQSGIQLGRDGRTPSGGFGWSRSLLSLRRSPPDPVFTHLLTEAPTHSPLRHESRRKYVWMRAHIPPERCVKTGSGGDLRR